jgi:hypothetical protein
MPKRQVVGMGDAPLGLIRIRLSGAEICSASIFFVFQDLTVEKLAFKRSQVESGFNLLQETAVVTFRVLFLHLTIGHERLFYSLAGKLCRECGHISFSG